MIKSISFIVLTHFFHFNELKILRRQDFTFFKLNQQYFFTVLKPETMKQLFFWKMQALLFFSTIIYREYFLNSQ